MGGSAGGGQVRRRGTGAEGLQVLSGRTMIEHGIERLGPQVDEIVINANQNLDKYAKLGYPVAPDVTGGFACFGVWGPRARDLLTPLTTASLANAAFPYLTAQAITRGSMPTLALGVTFVGE